jgi:hypothetical protein
VCHELGHTHCLVQPRPSPTISAGRGKNCTTMGKGVCQNRLQGSLVPVSSFADPHCFLRTWTQSKTSMRIWIHECGQLQRAKYQCKGSLRCLFLNKKDSLRHLESICRFLVEDTLTICMLLLSCPPQPQLEKLVPYIPLTSTVGQRPS